MIRLDDIALTTGASDYLADLPFDGLHAVFVRSSVAHGVIETIDVADALALDGVIAVETAETLGLGPFEHVGGLDPRQRSHPLASGRVRHVGEAVAVILTESESIAQDALELVVVEIDDLAAIVEPGPDAPLLYGDSGTNQAHRLDAEGEDDPVAGADLVVELTVANQRVASATMENDGIIATPDASGGLDVWCTSQGVHAIRSGLCRSLGRSPDTMRVRSPAVGGGFGGRATAPVEFAVVCQLAIRTGKPVRWLQTRWENLTGMPQGRGIQAAMRLGLDADGRLLGFDVEALADTGSTTHMAGLLMVSARRQAAGLYRLPHVRWQGRAMLTTTTPVGAYRGAGQPEANHARERIIDVAARRAGIDPIDFRRRNLLRADELPATQPGGVTYDDADPVGALDQAVDLADVARWRSEQADRRRQGSTRELGIGVACYAQTSGRGTPADSAVLRIDADGRVFLGCASPSHGQSHATTWRALIEERLGVAPEMIQIIDADTEAVADGQSTGGSRATQVLGSIITNACADMVASARIIAADRLEASPADLVVVPAGYGRGAGLSVAGVPTSRITWAEAAEESTSHCLESTRSESVAGEAHPYGTHVSVVEVDVDTGRIDLLAHTALDDCGTVLQPTFVAGQQHGGSAAGIAQALFESVSFDEYGNPEASTFLTYLLPGPTELPSITAHTISTPTARNALGTRGIGENGCNGATAAVHNAVIDALTPYGIEHIDLPLTPQRVWRAIAG